MHVNPLNRGDALGLADIIFEPNPWNKGLPWEETTFHPPFHIGYEGLTIPDVVLIECKCVEEAKMFSLDCKIEIKISKILINKTVPNNIKEMVYTHEMMHVRNMELIARHYGGLLTRLEEENMFCNKADCEQFKDNALDYLASELQKDVDEEAKHQNFVHPQPGVYYGPQQGFPPMPKNPQGTGDYPPQKKTPKK